MFNNLVESSGVRRGARGMRFFVGTAAVWSAVLAAGIAAGIMAFDARVSADFETSAMLSPVVPPPAPPPPPPGPARQQAPVTAAAAPRFEAVRAEPTHIMPPQPASPPVRVTGVGVPGGVPGGSDGGEIGGSGDVPGAPASDRPSVPAPPAPPEVPPVVRETEPQRTVARTPVRSTVLAGKARYKAQPAYPAMAQAAGIEGAVVVEVLVDEQGRVLTTRAVSGHPLLAPAALRAAKDWSFSPTLLNGLPVKVVGTITFNFRKK